MNKFPKWASGPRFTNREIEMPLVKSKRKRGPARQLRLGFRVDTAHRYRRCVLGSDDICWRSFRER